MNRIAFVKFIREVDKNYFYDNTHDKGGINDNIENLKNLPFFSDIYKHYKDFADNNRVAYLEQATDYIIEKLAISLSFEERKNLKTYAFYCGDLLSNIKRKEKIAKLNEDGFYKIDSNEKLDGKKIEFLIDTTGEAFGGIKKYKGRLKWSKADKRLIALKSRCRAKGYWVDSLGFDIYVKIC